MASVLRVINNQLYNRSILINSLDNGLPNSLPDERHKQQVYVPYTNPADSNVPGYSDFTLTDRVLRSANSGVIYKLNQQGIITITIIDSDDTIAPTVTSASYSDPTITINGTTFQSVSPDVTYVTFTDPSTGNSVTVSAFDFASLSSTQITIDKSKVTSLGTPTSGWEVVVKANSKNSNTGTIA